MSAAAGVPPERMRAFAAQALIDEVEAGVEAVGELVAVAEHDRLGLITATASGAPTRSEANGEREIALWKIGVTL